MLAYGWGAWLSPARLFAEVDAKRDLTDQLVDEERVRGMEAAAADIAGLGGSPTPDGAITVDDIVAFLSAFFTGCG